jgi:hypothetical protein
MLCAMSSTILPRSGQHRYGLVPVSRGIGVLLQGTMLLVVIATSRERASVRRVRAIIAGVLLLALALGVALSVVSPKLGSSIAGLAIVTVLVVLVRGVVRLVRDQGVTLQAVAGALAIYMLVGLTFALLIGFIAYVGPAYFVQGETQPLSQQVYFSFTTMTTTGYGDLTPATRAGRALSVLEMLVGQIYLVTVIGLLVGNLNRRSPHSEDASST